VLQTIGGTTAATRLKIDYGSDTATRQIDVGSGTIAFNAAIQFSPNTTLVKSGSGSLDLTAGGGVHLFTGTLSMASGTTNLISALPLAGVVTGSGGVVRLNPNNAANYALGSLSNSGTAVVVNDVGIADQSALNSGGTVSFSTTMEDTVGQMQFNSEVTLGGGVFVDVGKLYPDAKVVDPQRFPLFDFNLPVTGSFDTVSGRYAGETLAFNKDSGNPNLWVSQTAMNGQFMTFNQMSGELLVVPEPSTIAFAGVGCGLAGWQAFKQRRLRQRKRWESLDV
jgi:hypothetical protein